jgi:hypothetical protein
MTDLWENRETIAEKAIYCRIGKGVKVLEELNQSPPCLLILEKGEIAFETFGSGTITLRIGGILEEMIQEYSAPSSPKVSVDSDAFFWGVDYEGSQASLVEEDLLARQNIVGNLRFFNTMTGRQRSLVASALRLRRYNKGEYIAKEGDQTNSYCIIASGAVDCLKGETKIKTMKAGATFGEQGLYQESKMSISLLATEETELLSISRDAFKGILSCQVPLYQSIQRAALEELAVLNGLPSQEVENLLIQTAYQNKKQLEIVVQKGTPKLQVAILIEGKAVEVLLLLANTPFTRECSFGTEMKINGAGPNQERSGKGRSHWR